MLFRKLINTPRLVEVWRFVLFREYHHFNQRCNIRALIQVKLTTAYLVDAQLYSKKVKDKSKSKQNKPRVQMTDEELMEVLPLDELRNDLTAVIEGFKHDIKANFSLRTGSGIEDLMIEMDDSEYPLKEVAQISKKSQNLITINCTSLPDALKPVLKALRESGMNLNPQQEGTMIYVPIPKMTREHRELMAKNLKHHLSKIKVDISKIYSNYSNFARKQKEFKVSEDTIFHACEHVKYLTDNTFHECEKLYDTKVKDILGDN